MEGLDAKSEEESPVPLDKACRPDASDTAPPLTRKPVAWAVPRLGKSGPWIHPVFQKRIRPE